MARKTRSALATASSWCVTSTTWGKAWAARCGCRLPTTTWKPSRSRRVVRHREKSPEPRTATVGRRASLSPSPPTPVAGDGGGGEVEARGAAWAPKREPFFKPLEEEEEEERNAGGWRAKPVSPPPAGRAGRSQPRRMSSSLRPRQGVCSAAFPSNTLSGSRQARERLLATEGREATATTASRPRLRIPRETAKPVSPPPAGRAGRSQPRRMSSSLRPRQGVCSAAFPSNTLSGSRQARERLLATEGREATATTASRPRLRIPRET
ncbi:hypothetical protein CRUP_033858 [Coryphaenoides rupestris]|nr:hypothetical protein CRUP_033858 [Coryphaenoides rupestris]